MLKKLAEERISIDKEICSGKPCVKGTRIKVSDILLAIAEGLSNKEILRNFRTIRDEDIKACIAYAYCLSDQISINISGGKGKNILVENDEARKAEIEMETQRLFRESLEKEAERQEEITEETLAKIKEKKASKAEPKLRAPEKRLYDLEIELDKTASIKLFNSKSDKEQGLDMKHDNYIFELRDDKEYWLTYSIKDGVEIDKSMKRNIKLIYKGKENIFEGYLSNDRLHKIFIEKDEDGNTPGRVL